MLPRLISENQSGIIKGRSITENVLMAQEIVQGIFLPNKGGNMVIKLDMKKAYDRLSWSFVTSVLRRFGFSEEWIEMVWMLLSNVWYSIIINGIKRVFFTSSQGLKKGDP